MRLIVLAALLIAPLAARSLYFERQSSTLYRARIGGQTLIFHPNSLQFGDVSLRFVDASPASSLSGAGNSAPATYIQGTVRQTFPEFPKLDLRRVYPGIDVEFYGNGGNLEYDLVVSPGADLHRIRMLFDGARKVAIDRDGNLAVESRQGAFIQMLPRVFQSDGRRIEASYVVLANHQVGFRIGRRNPRLALTIDPELVFTKYFGGSGSDTPRAIATDAQGNIYIAGTSNSIDFPATNGFQVKVQPPLAAISANGATISHLPVGSESSILAIGGTSDGSVLYAIAPAATYVSSDHGATWTQNAPLQTASSTPSISSLLTPSTINNISVDAVDPSRVFVATSRGLFFTSQGGQSWFLYDYQLPSGPTGPVNAAWVAVSPTDHLTTYVATTQPAGLFKTTNAGVSWTQLTPSYPGQSSSNTPYPYVVTLAPNGTDLFVIDTNGTLVKSTDSGSTWQALSPQHYGALTLVIDPSNASNVYLLDYAGIEASSDGGMTFTKLMGLPGPQGTTNRLAVDPTTGTLYFTSTGSNAIYAIPAGGGAPQPLLLSTPDIHTLVTVGSQVYAGFDTPTVPFVAKWDPTGSNLLFSTFFGGSRGDSVAAMAIDPQGNPTLVGSTTSPDFPVTTTLGSPPNGSVVPVGYAARLSADGIRLLYSLFLGGPTAAYPDSTTPQALALDSSGAAYVTGGTGTVNFPLTPNAFQSARPQSTCNRPAGNLLLITNLSGNAFVTKISPDGSQLLYSTLVTGSCGSLGEGIAVDASGEAVVVGYTTSSDFPVSTGAYQPTFPGDLSQTLPPNASTVGFAAKLSAAGDHLVAGTYLGGSYTTIANATVLDAGGNIYLTGSSAKILPGATPGAFQTTPVDTCAYPFSIGPSLPYGGTNDAFVLKLDPTLSTPRYLTYLGGGCNDSGNTIALDASGNAWITGNTQSTDFPLKAPLQSGGPSFQFVSEISADGSQLLFSSATDGTALAIDPSGMINLAGPATTPSIAKRPQALFGNGTSVEWSRIAPAMTPPVVIDSIKPVNAFPPAILNPSYPGKNLAPGELVQITGRSLGPPTTTKGQLDATGHLPFTLSGTTVLFDNIPAPIVSAFDTAIVCFAPFEIRSTTNVVVESTGGKSNPVRVGVLSSELQILSVNNQDGTPNSASNPAKPGDELVFYVSGLGLTSPLSADGLTNTPPLAVPIAQVMVYLLTTATQPDFVGAAPGQIAGITQINVRLQAGNYSTNPISIGLNQANATVYVTP
jgi:uncharacterized protein (TIGR03437 family)